MTDQLNFDLLEKLVTQSWDETRSVRQELHALTVKVDEGFKNTRVHDFAHHSDMEVMERRVGDLELDVERLKQTNGINTASDT
ncbi:MAG: hypothetical protein AAFR02_00070 [Pseudomonadota bacterium]